jgi:sec-independent protein translocase protein TatA
MFNVGPGELIIIMALALIFFGPRKLPEIGRSIGNAMREFRRASSEFMEAMHSPVVDEQEETQAAVKSIEYPVTPELTGANNYETLPYGSDFASAHEPVAAAAQHDSAPGAAAHGSEATGRESESADAPAGSTGRAGAARGRKRSSGADTTPGAGSAPDRKV